MYLADVVIRTNQLVVRHRFAVVVCLIDDKIVKKQQIKVGKSVVNNTGL